MRIREFGGFQRISRWLTRRFAPRTLILLYHRVAELASDPQSLSVTPKHFAEHLEILRDYSRPMPLQQLVKILRDGNLPHLAVVVTFDDGYADNLYNARPLLDRYDIPATFFVTTGYMGDGREFWWDELDRLLLQPGTFPETLRLSINGTVHQWELGEAARYSEDTYLDYCGWNVLEDGNPSARHRVYRSLLEIMRPLSERSRRKILEELLVQAGAKSIGRLTHRTLSPAEVCRLAEGDLTEVGSHTVTHPILSTLPMDAQQAEIQEGKSCLEKIIGSPVISFSYPYGSQLDYGPQTVALVRGGGFICACSNFSGVICPGTDHFELPRTVVRDWDGEEFAQRLKGFFCG